MTGLDALLSRTLAERHATPIALFRIVLSLMLFRHVGSFLDDQLRDGFHGDFFHVPYASWIPAPSASGYLALLVGIGLCAAAALVGYRTRAALLIGAVLAAYHLSLNQLWYRHNRYFIVLALFLCALSGAGRALSVDSVRRPGPTTTTAWTGWLLRVQVSIVYLASATGKLLDPDWRGGHVLLDRATNGVDVPGLEGLDALLASHGFWQGVTVAALGIELFLGLALWIPRSRTLAVWIGIVFHGWIEIEYSVLVFSYLFVGSYVLWTRPTRRDRRLEIGRERRVAVGLAAWLDSLDWLEKLDIRVVDGDTITLTDPRGRRYVETAALVVAACAVPLSFVLAFPLRLANPLLSRVSRRVARLALSLLACVALLALTASLRLLPWRVPEDPMRYAWLPTTILAIQIAVGTRRARKRWLPDPPSGRREPAAGADPLQV